MQITDRKDFTIDLDGNDLVIKATDPNFGLQIYTQASGKPSQKHDLKPGDSLRVAIFSLRVANKFD